MMPVMDGWEFRRRQRKDPALASIHVIVMSANRCLPSAEAVLSPCAMLSKKLSHVAPRQASVAHPIHLATGRLLVPTPRGQDRPSPVRCPRGRRALARYL